jgi:hypothetical protein
MQYKCVLRRYRVKISNFSGGCKEEEFVIEASMMGSDYHIFKL